MAEFLLTEAELRRLTGRDRPTYQAKVLHALGIAFRKHPLDGNLLVSRSAAELALGAQLPADAEAEEPAEWHVNVNAIRDHGKKAPAH
jgi:hypothetical protein